MVHPLRLLGKAKARASARDFAFLDFVKDKVIVPDNYAFTDKYPSIATPMFGNDTLGDCVQAEDAHHEKHFNMLETGKDLTITDKEVEKAYFSQTGGQDTGLVIGDNLDLYRKKGFTMGGKNRKLKAYAAVDYRSDASLRLAIYANCGVKVGIQLPLSASDQLNAGRVWDKVPGKRGKAGSWGGHCVGLWGFRLDGKTRLYKCITWGMYQEMTEAFVLAYMDEAFAMFDAAGTAKSSVVNKKALDKRLAA